MARISDKHATLIHSLAQSPVGVMIASRNDNRIDFVNERCLETLLLNKDEVQGANVADVISGLNGLDVNGHPIPHEDFPIARSLREKGDSALTFSILQNTETKIISMRSSSIAVDDEIVGAISIVDDISEEFKMRNSLMSATMRLKNLWRITKSNSLSIKDICDVTLEAIAEITQSTYGFYGFFDEDEDNMIIHSWTGETMKGCGVVDKPVVFPVKKAGLWAEAIRQKAPLIVNDISTCQLPKKGFPDGHVKLENLMVVPHFSDKKIHSVAAVANKEFGYTDKDINNITEFLSDVQTVTLRIEAEALLRKSEKKYRDLVELMNEGVLILNQEGVATFVNSKLGEQLGRDISEIVGRKFEEFVYTENRDTFTRQQALRKDGISEPYEMTLISKNGDKIYTYASPTPLFDDADEITGSYEVITNITKIKQLEGQLLQAQKMETIGVLAAGIAHEINTPLQYVVGNEEFVKPFMVKLITLAKQLRNVLASGTPSDSMNIIKEKLDELDLDYMAEEVPNAMEDSIEGLNRISSIVQSIKEFAHPGREELQALDVNRQIREVIKLAENEWKYNAEVLTDFDDNLPELQYTPSDFDQILLNLIVNASHALQEKHGDGDSTGLIAISTYFDGENVKISVTDNGGGIPDSIKDKLFDPFFTTKEVGKGTGMGLSIASQLVEKHNGEIWFESQEGKTTFHIRTPIEQRRN